MPSATFTAWHRPPDFKPGNLLLSGNKVLVADFGISHSRGNDGVP